MLNMVDSKPDSLQQSLARLHAELANAHRLEALAVGFETDHPTLAASVRQFIALLGEAGL
jgi:hypothetical protein